MKVVRICRLTCAQLLRMLLTNHDYIAGKHSINCDHAFPAPSTPHAMSMPSACKIQGASQDRQSSHTSHSAVSQVLCKGSLHDEPWLPVQDRVLHRYVRTLMYQQSRQLLTEFSAIGSDCIPPTVVDSGQALCGQSSQAWLSKKGRGVSSSTRPSILYSSTLLPASWPSLPIAAACLSWLWSRMMSLW